MDVNQKVVLFFIICLSILNFLIWSKSNYGTTPHLKELYNGLLPGDLDSNGTDQKLNEIRKKIDLLLKSKSYEKEDFQQLLQKMKTFSTSQVPVRKQTLASIRSETQFALLYGSLAPEVFCPQKVRVGTMGDGGKWVCNIWNVPRDTVLLSLGLNNYIGFEEEWQNITSNANILYGVDVDEQSDFTKEKYKKLRGITKKALISEALTIEDLAKEFKISQIEILKIDIEGAEKTCLVPFLKKYQVCQIYLEVHGGAPEHSKLLREIAHLEYRLFAYEVNGYSMDACEYSFIHENCLEKYGGIRIANYLDF